MTTPTPEVNEDELSPEDMQRVLKIVSVIRKNIVKQGMQLGEVAAIGALLLAQAVCESSDEDDHPREVFLSAVDMLDTAFAFVEGVDEQEEGPKNEKPA